MEIIRASEMGFCFGVRRAINMLEKAAAQYGGLETLGVVVHNRQVVEKLAGKNIISVNSINEVRGNTVAVPTHGAAPWVTEEIKARGLRMIDTTCPTVRSAQKVAKRLAEEGFSVVIFGDVNHPEVAGLLGWAGGKGMANLGGQLLSSFDQLPHRLGIISQTTQTPAQFAEFTKRVIDSALAESVEMRIVNTICKATEKRQVAASKLAGMVNLIVVVGGHTSSNTRRLAETCAALGVETHLIETASEVDSTWVRENLRIGITAGTSTPGEAIDEVISKLAGMG